MSRHLFVVLFNLFLANFLLFRSTSYASEEGHEPNRAQSHQDGQTLQAMELFYRPGERHLTLELSVQHAQRVTKHWGWAGTFKFDSGNFLTDPTPPEVSAYVGPALYIGHDCHVTVGAGVEITERPWKFSAGVSCHHPHRYALVGVVEYGGESGLWYKFVIESYFERRFDVAFLAQRHHGLGPVLILHPGGAHSEMTKVDLHFSVLYDFETPLIHHEEQGTDWIGLLAAVTISY